MTFESEQSEVAQALLDANVVCPAHITQQSDDGTSRRFNIYRNNRATSLIENLEATYPAVLKLVGDSYFKAVARQFIDIHPPQSPVMFEYGENFGEYLCSMPTAQQILYVADVAKIEWLRNKAYHAPDAPLVKLSDAAAMLPEHLANAVPALHPSVGMLSSKWAAGSIWSATVAGQPEQMQIRVDIGEHLLVLRRGFDVVQYIVSGHEMQFLRSCAEGLNITQAASKVMEQDVDFNTGEALTKFIEMNTFSAIGHDSNQTNQTIKKA
ncbi:MAG: DNA-binding domain-containing protein [Granulosicoccus sp.]|nr:DNA-binding domain-containing protein [Granulosicoccus sp.]